jgi:DNA adenine methylase
VRYVGGKYRIAPRFAPVVDAAVGPGGTLWEPFCGGLGAAERFRAPGRHVLGDANPHLIRLLRAVLLEDWLPDLNLVTRERFLRYRADPDPDDPWTAFLGLGCTFGGMWFMGFVHYEYDAKREKIQSFPAGALRSLLRAKKALAGRELVLEVADFLEREPVDADAVYVDPPYEGTTGYGAVPSLDFRRLWRRLRAIASSGPTVLVSYDRFPVDVPTEVAWEGSRGTFLGPVAAGTRGTRRELLLRVLPGGPRFRRLAR